MLRRDFLKSAGCFVATASLGGTSACGSDEGGAKPGPDAGVTDAGSFPSMTFAFPQGVASGDPQATSVTLWTRVESLKPKLSPTSAKIELRLEVATDEQFKHVVARQSFNVGAASDHTANVLLNGLKPDTLYYYRFAAGSDESTVGRTWTAPDNDADVPVRFAWASCQDFSAGFYGAYRRMLNDDLAAAPTEQLRFVLFVGDFIYETRGESFQTGVDQDLNPVTLMDQAGKARKVPDFPSGGMTLASGGVAAETLDDYRHLYKTFLADPDLQAARARWPFVSVWDDHEFSNDCWQTQANYTDESSFDEPAQTRRVAASQAWWEFVPATLAELDADSNGKSPHNFMPAQVEDVKYSDPVDVSETNNQKALATLAIYRSLRFGKHVELVLTDNRSYRSDHALPEDVTFGNALVFDPRAGLSLEAVNGFDAGKTANDGKPADMVAGFMNTRKDSPPGTLLGADQKSWWKKVMSGSSASFKVWGNSLPLMRIRLDTSHAPLFPGDLVLSADGWDGYPSERRELMSYLKQQNVRNVVALSGDHHAHFAGLVHDDFDAADSTPVMLDFCGAAISSMTQFASVAGAIKAKDTPALDALVGPIVALITYDATKLGGSDKAVVNLNTLIRYGSGAAMVAAASNDRAMIEAARDPKVNPHLRYVDTNAAGYGLATFDGQGGEITLVTIERPITDRGEDGAEVRGKAVFKVPRLAEGDTLALAEPELSGEKPFPLG